MPGPAALRECAGLPRWVLGREDREGLSGKAGLKILFGRGTAMLGCLEGEKRYLRKRGMAPLRSSPSRCWVTLWSARYRGAPSPNFFSLPTTKRSSFSFAAPRVPAESRWKPEHPELPPSRTEPPRVPRDPSAPGLAGPPPRCTEPLLSLSQPSDPFEM